MIHGDVHFNNLIVEDGKLKIFDFENYGEDFLDKELDSLYRMIRKPRSYIKDDDYYPYNFDDFAMIKSYIESFYPEISKELYFDERLISYDILNSLKWISSYPTHELYKQVLFDESKKLFKKVN